jgi:hypothetical protein
LGKTEKNRLWKENRKFMKRLYVFSLLLAFVFGGCQSLQYTSFAPLTVTLEPVPDSPARYLVATNSSGKDLHNVVCTVYVWSKWDQPVMLGQRVYAGQPRVIGTAMVSVDLWGAGETYRFSRSPKEIQWAILERVTKIEVAGKCSEGTFRQVSMVD